MPVLVSSSVLGSSSLGLIGHTFCPISPDQFILLIQCRIASMAESALDGSALGRVRGVAPPFLS